MYERCTTMEIHEFSAFISNLSYISYLSVSSNLGTKHRAMTEPEEISRDGLPRTRSYDNYSSASCPIDSHSALHTLHFTSSFVSWFPPSKHSLLPAHPFPRNSLRSNVILAPVYLLLQNNTVNARFEQHQH